MKIYLNKNLKDGLYIGIDAASKTGWAVINVYQSKADLLDYGSIALERNIPELKKFEVFERTLESQISRFLKFPKVTVIIEDCFLGKWNPKTFKLLARLEGYLIRWIKAIKSTVSIVLVPAVTARKVLGAKGIRGAKRKANLVKFVNSLLHKQYFSKNHHDICDAIILALSAAVKEEVEDEKYSEIM